MDDISYPDLNQITACKHFLNQGCINYWIGLDMIASIKLDAFGKGGHQTMCRMSDGWYYAKDAEVKTLRAKYIELAEKVVRL